MVIGRINDNWNKVKTREELLELLKGNTYRFYNKLFEFSNRIRVFSYKRMY